jgi:D-proline reductase (dithiol) PrdB
VAGLEIPYIIRTRDYYRAQGYKADYQWAHYATVPFCTPTKPLAESRVVVITTSMPDGDGDKKHRRLASTSSLPAPLSRYTDDLSWDKENTHTRDVPSFLPIEQLYKLEQEKVIGSLAPRFHGVPTEYSIRNTVEKDAPEILKRCQEDQADLALLVPL